MHLALAPRRAIAATYGPAAPATLASLDQALAARAAAGLATLAYDPTAGLPDLGVPPAPLAPETLIAQLQAIDAALTARGTPIASLWIIGGPTTVPFGSLPNPVPDLDGPIRTDAVYGLADMATLLPRWPVGRTPDAEPAAPGLLARLLGHVAAAHRAGPRPSRRVVALSAARWAAVSAEVLAATGAADAVHILTPPARPRSGDLEAARVIYCNLHGVRSADGWFGQAPRDSGLVAALAPADLAGVNLAGAAVVSQACFGARLTAHGDDGTLALALLAAGAAALVVAHGLTYGAPDPPPSESDLLAQELIGALLHPGARAGAALLAAQAALLRERLLQRGQPDADEVKTLLGFVLYGDPALGLR